MIAIRFQKKRSALETVSRWALFLWVLGSSVSQAAGLVTVHLLATSDFTYPSFNSVTYPGAVANGGGLQIELALSPSLGFAVGGLYAPRAFRDLAGNFYSTHGFEIPVTLRYYLASFLFLGLGGFHHMGFGSVTLAGSDLGYPDASLSVTDFGARAEVGVRISSIFLGAAYQYGLSNGSIDTGTKITYRDIQVLWGLWF